MGGGGEKRDGGEALLEMCELSTFCFKLADCASSQFVRLISLVAANKRTRLAVALSEPSQG